MVLWNFSGCSSVRRACPIETPTNALEIAIQDAVETNDPLFQYSNLTSEEWWSLFGDSQLDFFINKAFANNPTIQSAREQVLSASYTADIIKSSLYPYISFGADVSRQKLSKTGVIPFNSGPKGSDTPTVNVPVTPGSQSKIPEYFTLYETELNFKYSFDFWDKNRNTFRAALGRVQANIAEEAYTRLLLGISVAKVYYELQVNYKRQEILTLLLENRTKFYELIQKRVAANIDNELSIQTALSNLADARDLLLDVQGQIAVEEHRLKAYLADNFSEEIDRINITQYPLPKIPLPPDLPLRLIAKRPDIIAQLWLIESAGREIEVARAGFYPDFSLSALFGFQTIHLSKLFQGPSTYFNVDPAVSLPIFDGGRLMGNLRASEIHYDLAILEYNNLVIDATKEVLDAIAVTHNSWKRFQVYERKFAAQSELNRITTLRVTHNLNNSLDALTTEGNMLISQDQETVALKRTLLAILDLIKSIGGGYDGC